MRYLLALLLLVTGWPDGRAAEPLAGSAEVVTNQLGAFTRTRPRGTMEPVRLFFDDGALRMHFRDSAGGDYALLLPAGSPVGWVTAANGGAMPVPRMRWPLWFDPAAPCQGQGMFADCQRLEAGIRAGRNAVRWRYRLPNATGPGMTGQGSMWLDVETGLVLAYEGRGGLGPEQRWEVRRVQYGPQPQGLFDPPPEAAGR